MVDVAPTPPTPPKVRRDQWKYIVGPLLVFLGNNLTGHFQADAKKDDAVKESAKVTEKATDSIYEKVAATQIQHTVALQDLAHLVANLTVEQARQRDRDAVRRKKTRGPADTAKVKGAQDDAATKLKEIKKDANALAAALVPPPATLPKAPPAPQVSPADAKSP